MQLPLPFGQKRSSAREVPLVAGRRTYIVEFVRVRRARHYIIRVKDEARLRVTIPWHGSRAEAERFVRERAPWIERERYRLLRERRAPEEWHDGSRILFCGCAVTLVVVEPDRSGRGPVTPRHMTVRFADQVVAVPLTAVDLRPYIQAHLLALAKRLLPERLAALAARHGFQPASVTVRNQRSRWGACSPSGRISLNWRLVQMSPAVRDYVLLHELVHLKHLNHSKRFWSELARVCPGYEEARRWLRANRELRAGPAQDAAHVPPPACRRD